VTVTHPQRSSVPRRLWRAAYRLILLVAVISLGLFLRGCVYRPTRGPTGGHFNQGKNAAWIGVEWASEPHTDREIARLADDLARRQIRTVFAYATYLRDTGDFNPTFAYAADFVQAFKRAQPTLKVLAWIGLPLKSSLGSVDLGDPATRQKITAQSVRFVHEMGFDGIHFDPEITRDGDTNVLSLLDETRQAIRPALLSMATRHIQPLFPGSVTLFGDLPGWHSGYYREIARRVDQIAVMSYDSALPAAWLYRQWMRFQVIGISQAVDGIGVELLFGVPTSEETTATHRPEAENMANGLLGILDGLDDLESVPGAVDGVAIYPYWETDAAEWAIYEALWLR
jgi:hypothetical protein